MSAHWERIDVARTAVTRWVATDVAVPLDTLSIWMDSHVMVQFITFLKEKNAKINYKPTENNECSSNATNSCEQLCTNTPGSYTCQCNAGFRLNTNGRTCDGMHIVVT